MKRGVLTIVLVTGLAAGAACQPLPPVETDSALVDCSQATERVELTASAHLDPSCVYTGGFDITASDVTLDCRRATIRGEPGTGRRGIAITAPEDVALSEITVRNCRVEGFLNSVRIMREGFRTFAEGEEWQHPTSDIVLEDNSFLRSRGVGVFVDAYVSDVTVRDNRIHHAGSSGLYLETGSRRNLVEDNGFYRNGYRENGPDGQLHTINGFDLWFWGVGREGVSVDGSYENTIVGNGFYDNSAGGIFLYKNCGEYPDSPRYFERRDHARDNVIEGNTFLEGRNGIWVGSRMGENTLPMECTDPAYIDEPLRRVVRDHAENNTLRSNRFVDVTYGIRVEDDGTTVEDNTFEGSAPDQHAIIIGTPDRTTVLGEPVTGTVVMGNDAAITGNDFPYRWVHGHVGTAFTGNTANGSAAMLCEGSPVPRQPFIFAIAVAPAGPGGTEPETTPDLTVPELGALAPCAEGSADVGRGTTRA